MRIIMCDENKVVPCASNNQSHILTFPPVLPFPPPDMPASTWARMQLTRPYHRCPPLAASRIHFCFRRSPPCPMRFGGSPQFLRSTYGNQRFARLASPVTFPGPLLLPVRSLTPAGFPPRYPGSGTTRSGRPTRSARLCGFPNPSTRPEQTR